MAVNIKNLSMPGVYEIEIPNGADNRGYFYKEYDEIAWNKNGLLFSPTEVMHIYSKRGVLRGLHFQNGEAQNRLVHCCLGEVWGVVADLRNNSPSAGKWIQVNMNENRAIFIPVGCALGTLAIQDSLISCMFDGHYNPESEDGIRWDDSLLSIDWPLQLFPDGIVISEKDNNWGTYKNYSEES